MKLASEEFDDALFCNFDGHLTEGSTFAFAYIKDGIFVTSPVDIGILDSITRKHMLKMAAETRNGNPRSPLSQRTRL